LNIPSAVGVPLMVIVLDAHAAVTPDGNPVAVPIPVAPVVVCVMLVKAELIRNVGELDGAAAVIATFITLMVPVALTVPQPPVKGIE
jgi:hypothetical protein